MISTEIMIPKVKEALRIKTTTFDEGELSDLIVAAQQDLGIAGVIIPYEYSAIVVRAIITYCKMNFGQPEDYDRLKRSYDEQKAQLSMTTGFTDWEPWIPTIKDDQSGLLAFEDGAIAYKDGESDV